MQVKSIAVPSVLALALAAVVSGCGSSSKSTSNSSSAAAPAAGTSAPSRTYTVKMSGSVEVPAGAPQGSGTAVIRVLGSKHQLCWSFKKLHSVVKPAAAHIHKGAAGTAGPIIIPLGGSYKAAGCASGVPNSQLADIVAAPKGFYVNVHSAKYPGGVVRAQL